MTEQQSQSEDSLRRCPRCGGLMIKHTGSAFYWHADFNHPSCEITNIVDPPKIEDTASGKPSDGSSSGIDKDGPPHGKRRKK
jgi:ssDNA-binding Zn-finger/Zn-ribbon topoisomerase 1